MEFSLGRGWKYVSVQGEFVVFFHIFFTFLIVLSLN